MGQAFTAVVGAIIFSAFVLGLAESISAIPFFVIVGLVVVAMSYGVFEVVKEWLKPGISKK